MVESVQETESSRRTDMLSKAYEDPKTKLEAGSAADDVEMDTKADSLDDKEEGGSALTRVVSHSPSAGTTTPQSKEVQLEDQSTRLPFHRILLIYAGIGFGLFLSFVDQTSVSTAAPTIGSDLGSSNR